MLIPFGILSASAVGSDYELIETQVLGSSATSVSFSSLGSYSSIYKHLQVRMVMRSTRSSGGDFSIMRINSDTTNSYARHQLYGNGSSVLSFALASINYVSLGSMPSASASTSIFSSQVIDILDAFSTTKNKTIRAIGGSQGDPAGSEIGLYSSGFFKTDSITTLTFTSGNSAQYLTGSRFSLYGIK